MNLSFFYILPNYIHITLSSLLLFVFPLPNIETY
ncbi:hypothetical protein HMPREF1497_2320, partial [Fusobacterium sp. CM21]